MHALTCTQCTHVYVGDGDTTRCEPGQVCRNSLLWNGNVFGGDVKVHRTSVQCVCKTWPSLHNEFVWMGTHHYVSKAAMHGGL